MKYLIPAIFLVVSIQSFGQFNKGDKVLGGTLGLNRDNNEDSGFGTTVNGTSFGIYPNFGVLINSNLEIGGELGYTRNTNEWSAPYGSSDRTSNYVTFGVYTRRYFVISDKFLFSLGADISYSDGKEKTLTVSQTEITEDENKHNSIGVTFRPSFIFFPSNNWGLQASIGNLSYTHSRNKTTDDSSNHFGVNYGTVSFGIAYYFRSNAE